jgi:hypothetical protein
MDSEVKTYVNYYDQQQSGGALQMEMYRGARRWGTQEQTGGSDNPVRTIIGTFGPALAHGAASFLADTATGFARGDELGEAARKAIAPAILTAVRSIGRQRGSGKRRHRRRPVLPLRGDGAGGFAAASKKKKTRKRKTKHQKGGSSRRKVYKRAATSRQRHRSSSKANRDVFNF